ncbi:uncharacterized protein HD556DRAFT_1054784 [Suillus plorans]|uniref:Uncharacterized protein n=1 Tax=Suillus plorans TaxID=116603 RepID=A0A9P7DB98_9AGAM|nr:uncharacterized protein HD556DRAFT_1054784 [Suillus plorans]KAG1786358.1 hypothetical protein HD556DRAFT_1054784 [Suillus plorans]
MRFEFEGAAPHFELSPRTLKFHHRPTLLMNSECYPSSARYIPVQSIQFIHQLLELRRKRLCTGHLGTQSQSQGPCLQPPFTNRISAPSRRKPTHGTNSPHKPPHPSEGTSTLHSPSHHPPAGLHHEWSALMPASAWNGSNFIARVRKHGTYQVRVSSQRCNTRRHQLNDRHLRPCLPHQICQRSCMRISAYHAEGRVTLTCCIRCYSMIRRREQQREKCSVDWEYHFGWYPQLMSSATHLFPCSSHKADSTVPPSGLRKQ